MIRHLHASRYRPQAAVGQHRSEAKKARECSREYNMSTKPARSKMSRKREEYAAMAGEAVVNQ